MKTLCRKYFPREFSEINEVFAKSAPGSITDGEVLDYEEEEEEEDGEENLARESLDNAAAEMGIGTSDLLDNLQVQDKEESTLPTNFCSGEQSSLQPRAGLTPVGRMEDSASDNLQQRDSLFTEASTRDHLAAQVGATTAQNAPDKGITHTENAFQTVIRLAVGDETNNVPGIDAQENQIGTVENQKEVSAPTESIKTFNGGDFAQHHDGTVPTSVQKLPLDIKAGEAKV